MADDLTPTERALVEDRLSEWQRRTRDTGFQEAIPDAEISRKRAQLVAEIRFLGRGNAAGRSGAGGPPLPRQPLKITIRERPDVCDGGVADYRATMTLKAGGACDIVYDEAQSMGYAGGPVRMETAKIRSKQRSPDGWRILSSRKLQHESGVPVPQDSVHPPAEFWEDGEEPAPPAPVRPLTDDDINELEEKLRATFQRYPDAVHKRRVTDSVITEMLAPGAGLAEAKRHPLFKKLEARADSLILDASTTRVKLRSCGAGDDKWLLDESDVMQPFHLKYLDLQHSAVGSKRPGDPLGSTPKPKAHRGDDGGGGGDPSGGGTEGSVYSCEHRVTLRDWTGAETTATLQFNSRVKVTVTPDEPKKLVACTAAEGAAEAYECATLVWDAAKSATFLSDRELFDADNSKLVSKAAARLQFWFKELRVQTAVQEDLLDLGAPPSSSDDEDGDSDDDYAGGAEEEGADAADGHVDGAAGSDVISISDGGQSDDDLSDHGPPTAGAATPPLGSSVLEEIFKRGGVRMTGFQLVEAHEAVVDETGCADWRAIASRVGISLAGLNQKQVNDTTQNLRRKYLNLSGAQNQPSALRGRSGAGRHEGGGRGRGRGRGRGVTAPRKLDQEMPPVKPITDEDKLADAEYAKASEQLKELELQHAALVQHLESEKQKQRELAAQSAAPSEADADVARLQAALDKHTERQQQLQRDAQEQQRRQEAERDAMEAQHDEAERAAAAAKQARANEAAELSRRHAEEQEDTGQQTSQAHDAIRDARTKLDTQVKQQALLLKARMGQRAKELIDKEAEEVRLAAALQALRSARDANSALGRVAAAVREFARIRDRIGTEKARGIIRIMTLNLATSFNPLKLTAQLKELKAEVAAAMAHRRDADAVVMVEVDVNSIASLSRAFETICGAQWCVQLAKGSDGQAAEAIAFAWDSATLTPHDATGMSRLHEVDMARKPVAMRFVTQSGFKFMLMGLHLKVKAEDAKSELAALTGTLSTMAEVVPEVMEHTILAGDFNLAPTRTLKPDPTLDKPKKPITTAFSDLNNRLRFWHTNEEHTNLPLIKKGDGLMVRDNFLLHESMVELLRDESGRRVGNPRACAHVIHIDALLVKAAEQLCGVGYQALLRGLDEHAQPDRPKAFCALGALDHCPVFIDLAIGGAAAGAASALPLPPPSQLLLLPAPPPPALPPSVPMRPAAAPPRADLAPAQSADAGGVESWAPEDVVAWLKSLDLGEDFPLQLLLRKLRTFTGEELVELKDNHLMAWGVDELNAVRFVKRVGKLRARAAA